MQSPEDVAPGRHIRSLAILNPLGDWGINGHCYELAEALGASGVAVDVYTSDISILPAARHHRCFRVLGSSLLKQRWRKGAPPDHPAGNSEPAPPRSSGPLVDDQPSAKLRHPLLWYLRERLLCLELIGRLKARGYDLIWTQWDEMSGYGNSFWSLSKTLGMRVAHSVHNVLPHEPTQEDRVRCGKLYRTCDLLVVHSNYARAELLDFSPGLASRIVVSALGAYTIYPRNPGARAGLRRQLEIGPGQVALLFCGAVRPYKNIDAVIEALRDSRLDRAVLVVAGREYKYPEASAADPLARTRRLAEHFGVGHKLRYIPRDLDHQEFADLFEAGDMVVLPYVKSFGSGQMLAGITFGKYVVASATGGMDEYLRCYRRGVLLEGIEPAQVAAGIAKACDALSANRHADIVEPPAELDWSRIARKCLLEMEARLFATG